MQFSLKTWRVRTVMVVFGVCLSHSTAYAAISNDNLIENSKECLKHFARQERQQGIPRQLLFAVASTESGRWHQGAGVALPWPWTVNAAGKGYYFESKSEAIAAVARFRAQGISSIDVGCMQINLKHHPTAFSNLTQAFDPERNVSYAATFLKNNYDELKSWDSAVAAYHSRTESLGNSYFAQVKKNWRRAIELVSSTGYTASPYVRVAGQRTQVQLADLSPASNEITNATIAQRSTQTSETTSSVDTPTIKQRSMRVIKVTDALPQQTAANVLVVKPNEEQTTSSTRQHVHVVDHDNQVTNFLQSKQSKITEKSNNNSYYTRVAGSTKSPEQKTSQKDGPRFIFY